MASAHPNRLRPRSDGAKAFGGDGCELGGDGCVSESGCADGVNHVCQAVEGIVGIDTGRLCQ